MMVNTITYNKLDSIFDLQYRNSISLLINYVFVSKQISKLME